MQRAARFDIFPSSLAGMGSPSLAVVDSLRDPFENPATITRLAGTTFFTTLGAYGVSDRGGVRGRCR